MTTSTHRSQRQDKSAKPAIAPSALQVRGTGNSAANPATAQAIPAFSHGVIDG